MSTAKSQDSAALRIGQSLGRGLVGVLRLEKAVWSFLSRVGLPLQVLFTVKWISRVAIFSAVALLATWGLLQLLGVIAILAIGVGVVTSPAVEQGLDRSQRVHFDLGADKETKIEMREGLDGYGTYVGSQRVD